MGLRSEIGVLVTTKTKGTNMKKLVLTSLLAAFAVSSANAATNYFVGGSAAFDLNSDHNNLVSVAPEFGWKVNSNWDLGVMGEFGYVRDSLDHASEYGIGAFARYHAARFGAFELLFKGTVAAEFEHAAGETASAIGASIIPMVTYDLSESFTLYANLNFLGVYAGYTFENKDLGIDDGWRFRGYADSDDVMNTTDFQIGFTYNF